MRKSLKLILLSVLLLAVLFVFTACGDSEKTTSEGENTTTSEASEENTEETSVDEEDDSSNESSSGNRVDKTDELEETEISRFNEQFEDYLGDSQRQTNVTTLISTLVSNATTNKNDAEFLPTVEYGDTVISGGEEAVEDIETYTGDLTSLRRKLSAAKTYSVEADYAENDLIEKIIITEN